MAHRSKGDFQLSLGFIISVVFAVVLLSVAIVWLRGTITNIGGLTDDLTQQAQQALTDTFRSSTTTFSLFPTQYKLGPGKELIMQAGIKNSDSQGKSRLFVINVEPSSVSNSVLTSFSCTGTSGLNCPVTGSTLKQFMQNWVTFSVAPQRVDVNQNGFFKISFLVPGNAPTGTYLFTVTSCYGGSGLADPTSITCTPTSSNIWGGSTQQVLLQVG